MFINNLLSTMFTLYVLYIKLELDDDTVDVWNQNNFNMLIN